MPLHGWQKRWPWGLVAVLRQHNGGSKLYAGATAHDVNWDDDRLSSEAGDRAADAVAHGRRLGCRQLRALAEAAARRFDPLQRRQIHLRRVPAGPTVFPRLSRASWHTNSGLRSEPANTCTEHILTHCACSWHDQPFEVYGCSTAPLALESCQR